MDSFLYTKFGIKPLEMLHHLTQNLHINNEGYL